MNPLQREWNHKRVGGRGDRLALARMNPLQREWNAGVFGRLDDDEPLQE